MEVFVAEKCGFCPGVKNAIRMAEDILSRHHQVYCLGPIIHNKDVVEELARKGLRTVDDVEQIEPGATILIRSHGAAPDEIRSLSRRKVNIIDATCVLVKRVQQIAAQMQADGYQVVIIGDSNHPEVRSVLGYAKEAIIVADEDDVHKIPENVKVGVVCQTTQSPEFFSSVLSAITRINFGELRVVNTLCREAIKRQESAVGLCRRVDVMFVLGGLESANTRKLAELCKKYNNQTFHLQNWDEFDKRTVLHKKIAGVTAGASTPEWIIEEFVDKLRQVK
jgi:4-hydroxy-3-methylbut-2-enyl diphosphate reductase